MSYKCKEVIGNATLYLGDCLEMFDEFGSVNTIITDPPYGMNWDTNTVRFSGGSNKNRGKRGMGKSNQKRVEGDDKPFNPAPWLVYDHVVLWGSNHYAEHLPVGTTLVWIKRNDTAFGSFLSDAEIAWMKGGHGVYCFRDVSFLRDGKLRVHPTQKPEKLMYWCIEKVGGSGVVLDPYMGSGTTGLACANLRRPFVGVEKVPKFFDVACERVAKAMGDFEIYKDKKKRGFLY